MTILTGGFASGKSTLLRESFLSSSGSAPIRLLVPTTTLAEHLRHRVTGASGHAGPAPVTTLAAVVAELTPEFGHPPASTIDHLLHSALTELDPPAFRGVRHYPGFRQRLSRIVDEFAGGGVSASTLQIALTKMPFATGRQRALAGIYALLERDLHARGFLLPGERIRLAASRVRNIPAATRFFVDGFFSMSAPETELLAAIAARHPLTLTVPTDWPEASETLSRLDHIEGNRIACSNIPTGRIRKFFGSGREQEVAEIARLIAQRLGDGEPAESIGIIIRQEEPYAALLRTVLSRYGISARFYFPERLDRQSTIRYFSAIVRALLSGWDHGALLELLASPASGGGTNETDRLDFDIREKMPGRGLDTLGEFGKRLNTLSEWPALHREPADWAAALAGLGEWAFANETIAPGSPESAVLWRRRASAIRAWTSALGEAAALLPAHSVTLAEFWPTIERVVQLTPLRVPDARANCVSVVDAFEARQWRFKTTFVCGLLEGEFPARPAADSIFDDATRIELRSHGIHLRTSSDLDQIEHSLLEVAVTRASHETFLSWPAFDANGEEALPAFALGHYAGEPTAAPESRLSPPTPFRMPQTLSFADADQIADLLPSPKKWRPSEIDCFRQCPFQYLGRYTIALKPAPVEPSERFDVRQQGSLVHSVIRRLAEAPQKGLDAIFEEEFRSLERKLNIPPSHEVLWHRLAMLRTLRAFLTSPTERANWQHHAEWTFEFDLIAGLTIRGRIDRFDASADARAFAIDFKYSKLERVKKLNSVQGGLYLLALQDAGYRPEGFSYVALRDEGEVITLEPKSLMEQAREDTIESVESIRQGLIAAQPADPDGCRYCDFLATCRIRERSGAAADAAGAAE